MPFEVNPSQLANSILGKLYDVLTNGDDTVPKSQNHFFAWATPGIPMDPSDFEFLETGLTGVLRGSDVAQLRGDATAGEPLSDADLDRLRAENSTRHYLQAENLSRITDIVVDATRGTVDALSTINVLNQHGTLTDAYEFTLRMSQVLDAELPADVVAKIARLRGLLTTTKTTKDLITDEEVEVTEPSPLMKAYKDKQAAYETAALEYNNRRIAGLAARTPEDVHFWAMNANILRNKVASAMDDWISAGHKNDVEKIGAYIDQVSQRDMSLLKREYQDDLKKATLTGLSSGSDFVYTALVPGSFATSNGWTGFTLTEGDYNSYANTTQSTDKWKAGGGFSLFGVFGSKGGGGSTTERREFTESFVSNNFGVSFEIAMVQIARPGVHTDFWRKRSWRFDPGQPDAKDEVVSDGAQPPQGLVPAYPVAAIFLRNLTLNIGHNESFQRAYDEIKNSGGGGSGGLFLGGINILGGASASTHKEVHEHGSSGSYNGQTVTVPGMQLIGFKCQVNDRRMPDPDPDITAWV